MEINNELIELVKLREEDRVKYKKTLTGIKYVIKDLMKVIEKASK